MTAPLIEMRRRRVLAAAGLMLAGSAVLLAGCERDPASQDIAGESRSGHRAELSASHILVAFEGTIGSSDGSTRTREEAHQRARRIAIRLRTGQGEMTDMAFRYSDDPTAERNHGYLGSFGLGELEPTLEEALLSLEIGAIGGPVESPHGWHVIRREPVRIVRIHHLLVSHRDANQVSGSIRRDRTEAAQIARALLRKVNCDHADLCDLTEQFSDDPENRLVCGDLGWIEPGLLEPEVEKTVFSLQPGQVSRVIESDYGFHLFWRE